MGYESKVEEADGIAEGVFFFGELLKLVEERADAHLVVMLFLPVDHPEGAFFREPARCYGEKVIVVRYKYQVLRGGVLEENIVIFILREVVDRSLDCPVTLAKSSDEAPIDVGVREQRKTRHLALMGPVYGSCDMAVFRSWLFRWLPSVAVNVVLPLTFELFRGTVAFSNRRVDLVFTIVIVGQSRIDLSQIELGKLFLDSLSRITAVEIEHDVFDRYTSSLDAGLSTSNLRVLRDVRVD